LDKDSNVSFSFDALRVMSFTNIKSANLMNNDKLSWIKVANDPKQQKLSFSIKKELDYVNIFVP